MHMHVDFPRRPVNTTRTMHVLRLDDTKIYILLARIGFVPPRNSA